MTASDHLSPPETPEISPSKGVTVPPLTDLMSEILAANHHEQNGEITLAIQIYERIVAADPEGTYGAIAQKALDNLGRARQTPQTSSSTVVSRGGGPRSGAASPTVPTDWFSNLSINTKQLVGLAMFEVLVLGLVVTGSTLISQSLRDQLRNQARSELAVMEANYNSQMDRLGASLRSQAMGSLIVGLTQSLAQGIGDTAPMQAQVDQALQQEAQAQQQDFLALVGPDQRVLASSQPLPPQTRLDPSGVVSKVLSFPQQVRSTSLLNPEELPPGMVAAESTTPVLVRLIAQPVEDPQTGEVLGALVAGSRVDGNPGWLEQTLQTFGDQVGETDLRVNGGYSGVYSYGEEGSQLVLSAYQGAEGLPETLVPLPEVEASRQLLQAAAEDPRRQPKIDRLPLGDRWYTVAAVALPNQVIAEDMGPTVEVTPADPQALLVRGTPESGLDRLLERALVKLVAVSAGVVILHVLLAIFLGRSITQPLLKLGQTARAFSQGDRSVRADVLSTDEIGQLARSFNDMAENIAQADAALEAEIAQRQEEARKQRQLREDLQEGVVKLLLDIEGAQRGDLTVHAAVTEGEVGSIADAFNATIRSLRQLATQARTVVDQVTRMVQQSETSARQLSPNALAQAAELNRILELVENNLTSTLQVAASARQAAEIAQRGAELARQGDAVIVDTVTNMETLRSSTADTAKQIKRLAESSQEISQIVAIIAGIADRTNLLAFNAALEAARAGEHGQGFRQIADEVRRLASQVNDFAHEIEHLIAGIQEDTAGVLQGMETSTAQVVTGTQLINQTQERLKELLHINQQIDGLLTTVSSATETQAEVSQQVNEAIAYVTTIAQNTSHEAQGIVSVLQDLVTEVQTLQQSVSRFQIETADREAQLLETH